MRELGEGGSSLKLGSGPRTLALFAAALATSTVSRGARADGPEGEHCNVTQQDKPPDNPFPQYPLLDGELIVAADYFQDWNTESHPGVGVSIDYVFFSNPSGQSSLGLLRLGVRNGLQYGKWADDLHGPVTWEPAFTVRYGPSFLLGDILDAYVVGEFGTPLSFDRKALVSGRPGVGLGVRVGRLVSLEAKYEPSFPFTGSFDEGGGHWSHGLAVSLGLQACGSACDAPDPTPAPHDRTCELYDLAEDVGCDGAPGDKWHTAMCAAVDDALDADEHPAGDTGDSVLAFLEAFTSGLRGTPMEKYAEGLRSRHVALRREWDDAQKRAREAAQSGRVLAEACSYAPYPVEIRKYLGCDTERPDCSRRVSACQ